MSLKNNSLLNNLIHSEEDDLKLYRTPSEEIADNDDDSNDKDEDEETNYRDPPEGQVRLRPSCVPFLPATVFFEYPFELNLVRDDISVIEPLRTRKLGYKSFWERICVRNAFKRAGFEKSTKSWTGLWSKHQNDTQLNDLECLQKVNHFPASWCVGRKDRLSRTMNTLKRLHGKEFDFHPESFILPADKDSFLRYIQTNCDKKRKDSNLWIVKPCASSCGRGISVVNASQAAAMASKNKKQLIQKYLMDPYLIDGKKFDLRIYVLVTGVDPLRVYVHKEGLTRISTSNYSVKNLSNRFAHLTNYSVNKKAINFKAASYAENTQADQNVNDEPANKPKETPANCSETEGFKWSLAAFKRWLSEREGNEKTEETFRKIHDLCVKTMIAAESEITPNVHRIVAYRTNCFELFGLDVILDSSLTPHLLEVNVSPSLMGSSPLDRRIKGMLLADIFHTVGLYPYDTQLLRKYSNNFGSEDIASSSGKLSNPSTPRNESSSIKYRNVTNSNPFGFINLSKLMTNQDAYRKNPSSRTIDLDALKTDSLSKENGSNNNCSWWQLLLLVEDEISRSKSSGFQILHPVRDKGSFYSSLFRNPRFSDHLLVRWIELGGIRGKALNYLPSEIRSFFPTPKPSRPSSAVPSRPQSAKYLSTPPVERFRKDPKQAVSPSSSSDISSIKQSLSSSKSFVEIPKPESTTVGQRNESLSLQPENSEIRDEVQNSKNPKQSSDSGSFALFGNQIPPRPPSSKSRASSASRLSQQSAHILTNPPAAIVEIEKILREDGSEEHQQLQVQNHYELIRKYKHDIVTLTSNRSHNPLLKHLPSELFTTKKSPRKANKIEEAEPVRNLESYYDQMANPTSPMRSEEKRKPAAVTSNNTSLLPPNPRRFLGAPSSDSVKFIKLQRMRTEKPTNGVFQEYNSNDYMESSSLKNHPSMQSANYSLIKRQSGALVLQVEDK